MVDDGVVDRAIKVLPRRAQYIERKETDREQICEEYLPVG